jgi:hypothetical protein
MSSGIKWSSGIGHQIVIGHRALAPGATAQSPGSQPSGASSNDENSKPGTTTQLTSVQAPSGRAACQAPAGTIP